MSEVNSLQTAPTLAPASNANLKNIFKTFTQQITLKLDEENFRSWKQQIERIIRTHKLHHLLVNPTIPVCYLSEADRSNDNENLA